MKKEIIDFYAEKGLHISKMINRRPYDVSPEHIEAAAELVYKDIQHGRELKNIQIASEVFRVAKDINGEKYAQENSRIIINEFKEEIELLRKKNNNTLEKNSTLVKEIVCKDINLNNLRWKNKRLKIYLKITLSALLIMEFIWLWPYIKILFRGF